MAVVLRWTIVGLAVVVGAGLLVLFGHWGLSAVRAARWRERVQDAHLALRRMLASGEVTEADLAPLRRIPFALQADLVHELAPSMRGEGSAVLREAGTRLGMVERALALVRSRLWSRRLRAVQVLAALDCEAGAIPGLLADPVGAVRERAVDWAADHPEPGVISRLLELLADPDEPTRFLAQNALHRMGQPVVEPLREYLSTRTGQAAVPALALATETGAASLLRPALERARDAEPAARAAALRLLGTIGGEEAVEEARWRLRDPVAAVRAEAAAALARMEHWPAAADVARLLRDAEWEVRRGAAMALRDLGSPGLILLRCSARESDTPAARLARQVLELPADPRPAGGATPWT